MEPDRSNLRRGASAGLVAGAVQVVVGRAADRLLRPPDGNANLAPRLVERLGEDAGVHVGAATRWTLGTVFHFAYGAAWGAGYAAAREELDLPPLLGGLALGSVIYVLTFPEWGAAIQTDTTAPPRRRSHAMTAVAATVAFAFGLATAAVYERLRALPPL